MGDESIWKKEISFGRKRKEDAPAESNPAEESTSVWKKELSFGRKKKQEETPAPEPEVVAEVPEEAPASEETWTRAVSFGRKVQPEPLAQEPVAEEPVAAPDDAAEEAPVAAPESDADRGAAELAVEVPTPAEPVWTKEVSFSRPHAPTTDPESIAAIPEPASGVHAPVTADEL